MHLYMPRSLLGCRRCRRDCAEALLSRKPARPLVELQKHQMLNEGRRWILHQALDHVPNDLEQWPSRWTQWRLRSISCKLSLPRFPSCHLFAPIADPPTPCCHFVNHMYHNRRCKHHARRSTQYSMQRQETSASMAERFVPRQERKKLVNARMFTPIASPRAQSHPDQARW